MSRLSDIINYQFLNIRKLDEESKEEITKPLAFAESDMIDYLNRYVKNHLNRFDSSRASSIAKRAIKRYEQAALDELDRNTRGYVGLADDLTRDEVNSFEHSKRINQSSLPDTYHDMNIEVSRDRVKAYMLGVSAQVNNAINQSLFQKMGSKKVKGDMIQFLNLKKNKITEIVRTESSSILNSRKLRNYFHLKDNYFKDMKKSIFHPIDHRTGRDSLQLANLDPIIPLDKPFKYTFTYRLKDGTLRKIKRVFMHPPDRPNDRGVLISIRDKWMKEN